MKVSVVIPALNEVENIKQVLEEIPKNVVDEIVVVDGHSTDGTPELVRSLGYEVITQKGKGYGEAISTGIKHAKGDVIVIMDADGSYEPRDIHKLVTCIEEGFDVAFASRYRPESGSHDDTLIRLAGNKLFTYLLNKIHKVGITDSLFLYVAAKKEVFESIRLKSSNFEYCIEFPIKVLRGGFRYTEIPSIERKRIAGKSKVNAFYHGLRILWALIKEKFTRYKLLTGKNQTPPSSQR